MLSTILIKKLQEIDPDGKLHVCCNGEAIHFIETLPGYYDGCFSYFDESEYFPEKIYMDNKNDKIIIHSLGVEDFLDNVEGELERIDMTNIEKKEDYLPWLEKKSKEVKELYKRLFEEHVCAVMNKLKDGYQIIQEKKEKIGIMNVTFYLKDGKKEQMCQGDCGVVLRSGFFIFEERDDFIYWRFDFIDGKKY